MKITERIDNITGLTDEYRHEILPAPKSVKIELTGRCNFRCTFCAHNTNLRKTEDMDRDLFRRLLTEMRHAGVEEIGLFYLGESFLCDWLPEAITYAKQTCKFPYVFLTTNGSMSTPDKVRQCIENGLDSLKFSLNYADEEQFAEIANVKPALFQKMKENIRWAKKVRDEVEAKTGKHCTLSGSYIRYDDDQMEKMNETLDELRPYLDEVYPLPLYNQADLVGGDATDKGWEVTAGNRGRWDALRDPLPCWAVFTEGHITYDGKLSACCFDHDGRFNMGDLTQRNFMSAWNSQKFQELRRAHLAEDVTGTPCEDCVAYA
jgi:radical SAM protein with 4Fe4S-binding SPASM domain